MIGIIFKSSLAFIVSFLLLSFHINNKSVFAHLTEVVGPVGKDVQKSLTKSVKRSMSQSSDIGREFFDNAEPKYMDHVKSKRSSTNANNGEMILEKLEQEDINELDKIINNN
ncbi:MAG: hypothetical protein CME62_02345 [Halobacteriovoraceae bacterium]|nr:hypothetical protein [Halobacteriovoraceae bacterium]|tara:strand:+ start:16281 stop:16616 length:336 start_codon:yes stop_codon:yes gene_type:complete